MTEAAFETLNQAAVAELKKVQQAGAAYFAAGDTGQVRAAADRVESIQALLRAIAQLKAQWDATLPAEPQPTVAPPPAMASKPQRTSPGMKTPQEHYWLPILQALVEKGGAGRTGRVLDRVGELMADILNDFDHERLPQQHDFRWRNTAMWARLDMVKAGYLSDQSAKGTWEITEAGRQYLNERG